MLEDANNALSPDLAPRLPHLRLTERDYQLFSFLLDQGFATLEALYFKFFDIRKSVSEPLPKNLEVTRQRLRLLEKYRFLVTQKVHTESKSLYLLTTKGFHVLRLKSETLAFAPPLRTVDFRWFDHDRAITFCRISLERDGIAKSWVPERRMKLQGYVQNGKVLPRHLVPDGIFVDPQGKRVAFEFERTRKARGRYQEKVRDYRELMRLGFFQKVFYVTLKREVAKELLDAINQQPDFLITPYSELLNQLKRNS